MKPQAAMIFAAGLGTRMGALTATRPKPLIEVGGRTLLDHALALVRDAGIPRIVVNSHAHAALLEAHLAAVAPEALVSREAERLETGGGLKRALPLLGPGPVVTLNADMVWRGPNPLTTLAGAWDPARMGALLCLVPRADAIGHEGPGDFFLRPDGRVERRGPAPAADFVYARGADDRPGGRRRHRGRGLFAERRLGRPACRGAALRHRPPRRLGRCRPSRGDRARRGGARPMSFFAPSAGPRVFGLPPGWTSTRALVAGLDVRLAGQPPEAAARVEIWVNTQRARRTLIAALADGPARLLPRIRVVTELALNPGLALDLPPPVPALRRKLELARLVGRLITAEPGLASETAAFDLADSLGELLDELQGEGLGPEALAAIDTGEHAAHWQRSLGFLGLLGDYVAAAGLTEGQGRMRLVVDAVAAAWAAAPPAHPVIVAGSTGSRTATRRFMTAVAGLPQGALILPGFDSARPPRSGSGSAMRMPAPPTIQQRGFRTLADALGFDLAAVAPWQPVPPPAPERNALVSLALRPAPVTDQWRAGLAGTLATATAGLTWLEAPDPRAEARAVALALRAAAAAGSHARSSRPTAPSPAASPPSSIAGS